ncbi:helix-turn-helix domain-containing protein [Roseomonas sp. HF4]|uniref:helix-turn-helix domain-containing protein n=1 Tax=Roseomonas sp. HF4 TaxID=2562313 RepID=UPI0010BF99F9|nr:helix-turn-helix transcriptional regulator [Roseomonas sp. HF4]
MTGPLTPPELAPRDRRAPFANKRAPAESDRAVGVQIRRLRRTAGMTLKALGGAVGISSVQLQRYEVGASRIAASRLLAIAGALGVRAGILLNEPHALLASPPVRRTGDDAAELVRIFNGISDPAHREAIMALIRAVAMPAQLAQGPVGAYAPIMPMSVNGSIPAASE